MVCEKCKSFPCLDGGFGTFGGLVVVFFLSSS
jgi:hypothetical protein